MLTVEELYEVAEQAQAKLEEDWRLYALDGDAPVISPAMVRIVANILDARMPQENISRVIIPGKNPKTVHLVEATPEHTNGNGPAEQLETSL